MAVLIGDSGAGATTTDFFGAGDLAATRWIAAATGTVDTIRFNNRIAGTYTNLQVGIYSDTPGGTPPGTAVPNAKLGEGTITDTSLGIVSVTGLSIAVTSGVAYWLVMNPTTGQANFFVGTGTATPAGYKGNSPQTAGVLPATFPAINFSDATNVIPMVAEGTTGGATASASPRSFNAIPFIGGGL